jgi:hypothetical protein
VTKESCNEKFPAEDSMKLADAQMYKKKAIQKQK